MEKIDWISWVGPGWYTPMGTYKAWIYVGENVENYHHFAMAVYFTTPDEFDKMIEKEANDDRMADSRRT